MIMMILGKCWQLFTGYGYFWGLNLGGFLGFEFSFLSITLLFRNEEEWLQNKINHQQSNTDEQ